MKAHDNSLYPGDWIEFKLNGSEQLGRLVEVVDCVYGRVELQCGVFTVPLAYAKLVHREIPQDYPLCVLPDYDY